MPDYRGKSHYFDKAVGNGLYEQVCDKRHLSHWPLWNDVRIPKRLPRCKKCAATVARWEKEANG